MKGQNRHQLMQRLCLLSAFLQSKESSGRKPPLHKIDLSTKHRPKPSFCLSKIMKKLIINNLEFNTVSKNHLIFQYSGK